MMNDVVSLFDFLGVEKTDLLGHSMGGKLAMIITLLKPKYVNKVIIADIAPIDYDNDDNLIINSLLDMNLDLIKNRGEADFFLSKYVDQKLLRSFLSSSKKKFLQAPPKRYVVSFFNKTFCLII